MKYTINEQDKEIILVGACTVEDLHTTFEKLSQVFHDFESWQVKGISKDNAPETPREPLSVSEELDKMLREEG